MTAQHPLDFDEDWYLDHVVLARELGETSWRTSWRTRADALARSPAGRCAVGQGFVLTRDQARSCGHSHAEQRRLVRAGAWQVTSFGCLAPFRSDDRATAQVLAATSLVLKRAGHVISHRSAALVHGLPVITSADRPFICSELTAVNPHCQRRQASAHVRTSPLPANSVSMWFGAPVTTAARTVVDLARLDRGQGLAAADAALRERTATGPALATAIDHLRGRPGAARARDVLVLASPLSESPLESLTRLVLHDRHVPRPELQMWIEDPSDGWRARVDMGWRRRRVVLEADGRVKYTGDALWREKLRQERLERLGYRVVRVSWPQVEHEPDAVAERVLWALQGH